MCLWRIDLVRELVEFVLIMMRGRTLYIVAAGGTRGDSPCFSEAMV